MSHYAENRKSCAGYAEGVNKFVPRRVNRHVSTPVYSIPVGEPEQVQVSEPVSAVWAPTGTRPFNVE